MITIFMSFHLQIYCYEDTHIIAVYRAPVGNIIQDNSWGVEVLLEGIVTIKGTVLYENDFSAMIGGIEIILNESN